MSVKFFNIFSLSRAGSGASVSASVSAFVFGGITSAGSSYIVQLLHGVFQLPMVASVFLVQVFTDYADKFLILVIVTLIIQRIPTRIKEKV